MRNYAQEYQANIKLLDSFLAPFHQGILTPDKSKGLAWLLHLWPLWYSFLWIIFYAYLILVHTAGPEIVSQQMLSMFCIVQLAAKQLNAKWQVGCLKKLLKWCEEVYTGQLSKVEYQRVVDRVFEETNSTIRTCIRWVVCVVQNGASNEGVSSRLPCPELIAFCWDQQLPRTSCNPCCEEIERRPRWCQSTTPSIGPSTFSWPSTLDRCCTGSASVSCSAVTMPFSCSLS